MQLGEIHLFDIEKGEMTRRYTFILAKMYCVRDCSENPFCEVRTKRLQRKARPARGTPKIKDKKAKDYSGLENP